MTDMTEAKLAELERLLAAGTQGRRVQFHPSYCVEAEGTPFSSWDTSHDVSVILPDGERYRGYALFKHAADASLHDAAVNNLPALIAEVRALRAEVERLRDEAAEARRRRDEWKAKAEGFDTIRNALREKVGAPWPPNLSRAMWAGLAADQKKRADDAEAEIKRLRAADRWVHLGHVEKSAVYIEGRCAGLERAAQWHDDRAALNLQIAAEADANRNAKDRSAAREAALVHTCSAAAFRAMIDAGQGGSDG